MTTIDLKISELRKRKGITQQELGDILGVSFQSVSKWEHGITMPDITILPALSEYFKVSVDELLGLKPFGYEYNPSNSGTREYWAGRMQYLKRTRKNFWNLDYMQFLIEKVWKLQKPVDILDCGCGFGFLGLMLLPLLPEGSTYTGVDFSKELIKNGKVLFENEGWRADFIESDLFEFHTPRRYDVVISQAVLRHVDNGEGFLNKMICFAKSGGLIVSLEVNREFEADGLYVEGMDYAWLCEHTGLKKLWKTEYEMQGRDYSIAMKVPHLMRKAGLQNIDVRMNDRVTYLAPEKNDYAQMLLDIAHADHWEEEATKDELEEKIQYCMNHGMNRKEAEDYCRLQMGIVKFLKDNRQSAALTQFNGVLISYGWKDQS